MAANPNHTGPYAHVVHCDCCGEDYAAIYKICPFCEGIPPIEWEDETGPIRAKGGKRLVNNTRGGGYHNGPTPGRIIGIIVTLALMIAAVFIVISVLQPMISRGNTPTPDPSTSPGPTGMISPTPDVSSHPDPTDVVSPTPDTSSETTATGITLNKTDVSLAQAGDSFVITATLLPAGGTGTITWSSSDPAVATVDTDGTVTGVGSGRADITASLPNGTETTCIVRCKFDDTTITSEALTLNRTDFTLPIGSSFQLTVSGVSGTPVWHIANSSIATISSDGTVTGVSKGMTTVTCTVNGNTATCIVRCS